MINLCNQVPSVYPSASRDFQYLSQLINIVLNSVKHNVDDLYSLPNTTADPKISELLALTLGFKIKRNYDQKQLAALAAILPIILRYKGTTKAVEMAAKALIVASGSLGDVTIYVDGAQLEVVLPKDLIDTTLFLDLLDYILPAGMTCRIVRKTQTVRQLENIEVRCSDQFTVGIYDDLSVNSNTDLASGLAVMFDITDLNSVDGNMPLDPMTYTTANFKSGIDERLILNTGMLDNTVIPVIPTTVVPDTDEEPLAKALYSTEPTGENLALYSTEPDGSRLQLLVDK